MTAYEDAITRLVDDARRVQVDDLPGVSDVVRQRVRSGARGAAVAATAGAMTLGPALPAVADDAAPAGRLWSQDDGAVQPPPPPADPTTPSAPADPTTSPPPADPTTPPPSAGPVPDTDPLPAGDRPPDGPAPIATPDSPDDSGEPGGPAAPGVPDVIPGIRPPVQIPLNGRESVAPERTPSAMPRPGPQIPVVGQPPTQGGRPLPAPAVPGDPTPDPNPVPVPELDPSPGRPVIVGQAPAPAPAGGGISDITIDFSDPTAGDVAVETRPVPLDGTTTYVVEPGDSLWSIATDLLADMEINATVTQVDTAVEVIYDTNRDVIGEDPDVLVIGITLEIPDELLPVSTTTEDG